MMTMIPERKDTGITFHNNKNVRSCFKFVRTENTDSIRNTIPKIPMKVINVIRCMSVSAWYSFLYGTQNNACSTDWIKKITMRIEQVHVSPTSIANQVNVGDAPSNAT